MITLKKATLLLESFKSRMGKTTNPQMHYNLLEIVRQFEGHGLEHISNPFAKEEIDNVVRHMPVDKAPRPDGFNGLFFKKNVGISSKKTYTNCAMISLLAK